MNDKVAAIIVTYNPDNPALGRLIEKCSTQLETIVLVDNGSTTSLADWLKKNSYTKVTLLTLGKNRGVATAQNTGIDWARTKGAEQILLFDQDSNPPVDLVMRLQTALADLERKGEKVAAVGPRNLDSRWSKGTSFSPFSRFKHGRIAACYPSEDTPYVSADFLIASGSLIPLQAMEAIGGMNEDLFIDYVDVEWCARAQEAGWAMYGVWDVVMEHELGDDRVDVLGHSLAVRSPIRHYYTIRNAVWLCCRSQLPWGWKLPIALQGLGRFAAYSLFMPQAFRHFRFMCLGLWHGVCGRMGRL